MARLPVIVQYQATQLYKRSVVPRFFSIGGHALNDRVTTLCASPLGMFFYNQRAILYGLSGIHILLLASVALYNHFPSQSTRIVTLLSGGWLLGVLFTIVRHSHFTHELQKWANNPTVAELPSVFDIYFAADSIILLILCIMGRSWKLPIDQLLFVVFANLLAYSTHIGGDRQHRFAPFALALILSMAVLALVFPPEGSWHSLEPPLFRSIFQAGPLLALVVVTPLSVSMISWLRMIEHRVTKERLALFGTYASTLSDGPPISGSHEDKSDSQSRQEDFKRRVRTVITDLCAPHTGLGYISGRLFISEEHKDFGRLLVPYTQTNVSSGSAISDRGLVEHFIKVGSLLRFSPERVECPIALPDIDTLFSSPPGAAVHAIVPLAIHNRPKGLLILYGSKDGLASFPQEKVFLDSLGKMIASAIEEWEARFALDAHGRISSLHSSPDIDELFKKAAAMLRECLNASACMIVFRPDLTTDELTIETVDGFRTSSFPKDYPGPESQTARSALQGVPIRYDDVDSHRTEFNPKLLEQFEKALGSRVQSWMAIPIGVKGSSYGAIKVINKRSYCRWFTNADELLAQALAVQLRTIIERFLYVRQIRTAQEKIEKHLDFVSAARKEAEDVARQRQDDIMIISHQLQGPLASVVGSLSKIKHQVFARDWKAIQGSFDAIRGTIEDAITLSYGIVTTFAKDAGRPTSLDEVEVDAPFELRLLAQRLQKTNAREDLTFAFMLEKGFPTIKIDKSIFTSVFYSLLHNAMKYADEHTTVTLECSRERSTGHSALKVKTLGEPIHPGEKEKIFEKYQRGAVIARTGRHHSGVGIGLWVARQLLAETGGTIRVELDIMEPRRAVFIVEL